MVDAALWGGAHVRIVGAGVHRRVISLRRGLEPVFAGGVPRVAGRSLRANDSGLAGTAAAPVPARARRHGAGDLVDHDAGRAGRRAGAGRLYLRRLELAVDLLY